MDVILRRAATGSGPAGAPEGAHSYTKFILCDRPD